MATDRQGGPSLLTLGGGVLLAISVFLPWYALTITANGVAAAQQNLNSVAQQFGNSAFQSTANSVGNGFGSLVGKQLGTVSAHQVLKYVSVALLVLAGIAILVTMLRLVGSAGPSQPRGTLAVVGFGAVVCVVFRMLVRPAVDDNVFSISIGWGAWLALGSSVAIIVGDLWPTRATRSEPSTSPPGSNPGGLTYPGGLPGANRAPGPGTPGRPGGPSGPAGPGGPATPGGLITPPRPPGWS